MDSEWHTHDGDFTQLVNDAGFTNFRSDVTDRYTPTFSSQHELDPENDVQMDIGSNFVLQIGVVTDLDKARVHLESSRALSPQGVRGKA